MQTHIATRTQYRPAAQARFPLLTWMRIARQRRLLARLDDRALADIGLSRREALAEAHRPFWDMG